MSHLFLLLIYISFISLGLPDALLGSAWPTIYPEFEIPISCAGVISMIIALGTVVSSLMNSRLSQRLGTGKITFISVAITAVALLGFSVSSSFWMLCLWAVPYGLGAGSVDTSLNHYVALHYSSRHMSWLHCMWGIGATAGPYIMGYVLSRGWRWNIGYRVVGVLQVSLAVILLISLPLWKKPLREESSGSGDARPLSLREVVKMPGAREIMLAFFCYCALEQTTGLWASSYLVLYKGVDSNTAAAFAAMFFLGITFGRALNGFLTMKLSDTQLIRLGECVIAIGIAVMLLPLNQSLSLVGLILIGLGCAPIYPCVIHSTPTHFGAAQSQTLIGVQMASAYIGTCLMPMLFGLIANHISASLLPVYLLINLGVMVFMYEKLLKRATIRTNFS